MRDLGYQQAFFGNRIDCTFIEPHPDLLFKLIREDDRRRVHIVPRLLQEVETRL